MDASGEGPPHRGPGRDEAGAPADPRRRASEERTDQVVSRHPGQRVPNKTDRTSIGLCATGRRQERREQDARARERPDDAGGLELLRLPLLPDRGVAEPLGDGLLLTSRPRPIHPAGAGDQTAHNTRIGPRLVITSFTAFPGVLLHRRTTLSRGVVTESAPPGRASFSHIGRRRTRVFDSAGSALRTPCP